MKARLFTRVQTGPGAHPDSYTMVTVEFLGLKRPGRGADHPLSRAEVKEGVEIYLYSTYRPSWPVLGDLYLYLHYLKNQSTPHFFLLRFPTGSTTFTPKFANLKAFGKSWV
jgi:hypothetical protein